MRIVERHDHGRSDIQRLVDESKQAIDLMLESAVSSPANSIDFVAHLAQIWTWYGLADDPQAARVETREAARLAAQLSVDMFVLADAEPGVTVNVDVGDGTVNSVGTGPIPAANLMTWFSAYWWSQTARDGHAEDVLGRFSLDTLTAKGKFDVYWCRMFDVLRGFDRDDDAWPQAISAAMKSIDKPAVSTREETMLLVLDLFGMLAAIGDQDEFNNQLVKALESHRTYWTATQERREDPRGFASFPILGLAAKAMYEGIQIEVESDYLPKGLLEHPRWMFDLT